MFIERMLVVFSVVTLALALTHMATSMISANPKPRAPVVVRPPDAPTLLKKLDTLDGRLHEAQSSIDEVLVKLSNAHEESERDASRIRLDVLYRLEDGLAHDIARTRDQLAAFSNR